MKKSQVNAIFIDQTKRKQSILWFSIGILVLAFHTILLLAIYANKGTTYLVSYEEDGNVDYKVYLKKNDFFEEDYLGLDNKYIASLIDNINATFKYDIKMSEKNVNYKYSYRLVSEVIVEENKESKPLYKKEEEILRINDVTVSGKNKVSIVENVDVDYNKYNSLIKKFVSTYSLENIKSVLKISMYIDVIGSCESFESDSNNEAIISIEIPLTTKTVGIDIDNSIVEESDNIIVCSDANGFTVLYLIGGMLFLAGTICLTVFLYRYIVRTRTAKTIYDVELKKILSNYHSYIQKISNNVDFRDQSELYIDDKLIYKNCQYFQLEAFTDMLEIRDSLNTPILMASDETNTATYFIILDALNKAIYIYGLKVNDIKKKIRRNTRKLREFQDLDED